MSPFKGVFLRSFSGQLSAAFPPGRFGLCLVCSFEPFSQELVCELSRDPPPLKRQRWPSHGPDFGVPIETILAVAQPFSEKRPFQTRRISGFAPALAGGAAVPNETDSVSPRRRAARRSRPRSCHARPRTEALRHLHHLGHFRRHGIRPRVVRLLRHGRVRNVIGQTAPGPWPHHHERPPL